jgi:hypothetical protein
MSFDQVEQNLVGGKVTPCCDPFYDGTVLKIIVIIVVIANIEKPVGSEPERLMNMEV